MQPARAIHTRSELGKEKSIKSGLLKNQLHLVKRKDGRHEIEPIPEKLSFDKGFFLFIRAIQLLSENNEGVVVVGLAGPSGAGKTVFTDKVSNFLPNIACISMDNYNDASRLVDGNFDDPRLTDYDLLLGNLRDLKQGKAVDVPIYDFKQSKRVGFRRVEVPTSRIIVVEGIYALSEKVRPFLDLRVSITGGVHFDLVKRVLRDINRSGQAPEDIIHQISETVYPMYKAFIEPDLQEAHIRIVNKFNPFTGFQNATYILKSLKEVPEAEIRSVLSEKHQESVEETYDIYLLPPGEDPETCQSYLRMRNRDGRYSLMFEEWVTDGPFIISPRITFEVSVRLLGGLMALGYTMSSILKRTTHVFVDEKVMIKIDKLEQLHRRYVQVQGKDRTFVREVAEKLGLEGTYNPRSYIEQIQLEKLISEVQKMPEELKTRLSINSEPASPIVANSWLDQRHTHGSRLSGLNRIIEQNNVSSSAPVAAHQPELHGGPAEERTQKRDRMRWEDTNGRNTPEQDAAAPFEETERKLMESIAGLSEKLDELLSKVGEIESRVGDIEHRNTATSATMPSPFLHRASSGGIPLAPGPPAGSHGGMRPDGSHGGVPLVGSYGRGGDHFLHSNGPNQTAPAGNLVGTGRLSTTDLHGLSNGHRETSPELDSNLHHELRTIVRGQRLLLAQFEVFGNRLGELVDAQRSSARTSSRGFWGSLLGSMRTSRAGLVSGVAVAVAASTVLVSFVIIKAHARQSSSL